MTTANTTPAPLSAEQLDKLAQDAGFVLNPVEQLVVPAPNCDARPHLTKFAALIAQQATASRGEPSDEVSAYEQWAEDFIVEKRRGPTNLEAWQAARASHGAQVQSDITPWHDRVSEDVHPDDAMLAEITELRAALANRASSAPGEQDEHAAFNRWFNASGFTKYRDSMWAAWEARAAIGSVSSAAAEGEAERKLKIANRLILRLSGELEEFRTPAATTSPAGAASSAQVVEALAARLKSMGVTNIGITTGPQATPEKVAAEIMRALDEIEGKSTPASDTRAAVLLNAKEMAALRRFNETCEDGEGYDVRKDMMKRLATIGVVRRTSGSIYEITEFGMYLLDGTIASAVEKSWDRFVAQIERQSAAPTAAIAEADAKDAAKVRALHAAVAALYFDDSSDFRPALGSVIRHLDPAMAGEMLANPKAAYDKAQAAMSATQQAQNSAKGSDAGGAA